MLAHSPWLGRLAAFLTAALALAGDVSFELSPRQGWVGTPSVLKITVRDGSAIADPVLPEVDGLIIAQQPGRNALNSMQVINGKVTRENSTTIHVLVTPTRAGTFTIPPVTIDVDGVEKSSGPLAFSSLKSEAGELLKAEVIAPEGPLWAGQTVQATLRIVVRPYQSREHRVTLSEGDMWQFIDSEKCDFGPFTRRLNELAQSRQRPQGHEELVDGQARLVYEVSAPVTLTTAGVPDASKIVITWNYPTRLTAARDFFGRNELSVSGTRPVTAPATTAGITVNPLPEAGRPASFTGAVGSFAVAATAKPLSVSVGDPVTLTYTITAVGQDSALEAVGPPRLDSKELTDDFRMPTAPLAGSIQGNTKVFTQTLRPTSEEVRAIPAIPFSWFDPSTGSYATASSEPMALSVAPVERIATDAIVRTPQDAAAQTPQLVATAGGLGANAAVTPALVATQGAAPAWIAWSTVLLVPPLACAGALLLRNRQDRRAGDRGWMQEQHARRRARTHARGGDGATAVAGYIADRMRRPSGTVTRSEARRFLQSAGAPAEVQEQVDQVLAHAERLRFAAPGSQPASTAAEGPHGASCIDALERLDWRAARAQEGSNG